MIEPRFVVFLGALAFSLVIGPRLAQTSTPEIGIDYPPAAREFVEVLRDPSQSSDCEDELHDLVRRGLFDADGAQVQRFILFLSEVSRWYDLTAFEDVLLSFDEAAQRTIGAGLLDHSVLDRMPREERRDMYRSVLSSGTGRLKYGTELDRYIAILRASQEGFLELYNAVVASMDTLPQEVRDHLDMKELEWCFRLRDGAPDRNEGDRLVLNRFLDLAKGPEDLEEGDFRAIQRAITKAASSACDRGPMNAFDPAGCQEWRLALSGIVSDLRGNEKRWPPSPLVDPTFISNLGDATR